MVSVNSLTHKELEKLDPQKAFNNHNKDFSSIVKWLEEFYQEYENSEKIIQLLSTWLYFFRSIHESYGMAGVKEFSQSDFGCPIRFSFYYEFGFNVGNKAKSFKSHTLFKILNGFLRNALLPGSKVNSVYSKYRWRFAKFILVNIPIKVQESRKKVLIKKIISFFNDHFTEESLCEVRMYLDDALPGVFYEEQVKVSVRRELNVECAPWTFLEFSGFEKVFLLDRYVKVTGLQHGGGYFAFEHQYATQFEDNISDDYFGWGLSDYRNIRQHRYPHGNQISKETIIPRRLVWVEHGRLPIYNYFIWSTQVRQLYNQDAVKYIYTELGNVKIEFYSMPYPNNLRSNQYDGLRGIEIDNASVRGENILSKGDVVIFDDSGSSLIHHCIEQEIPFILVVSREDVLRFKEKQNEWFNVIRDAELAFYDDEAGMMSKRINEIFESKFDLPLKLKEFHDVVFINI
jgi:hypothetical protein